jgi:hypothetical protein
MDPIGAQAACEAAVKADPSSKSGQAAAAKLASLKEAAEKERRKKAAADRSPQGWKWVTRCIWKGSTVRRCSKDRPLPSATRTRASCRPSR